MVEKRLLCPNRRRRTPAQFSWLDHRLVRERRLESCPVEAWALYLFLVTVGDAQGLSYYSDASLTARVPLDRHELLRARNALNLRRDRSIERRIRLARFPVKKTLDSFDWSWPKNINRLQVQNLFRLRFLDDATNVVLVGGVGLGKSHLVTALGLQACERGYSVLFTSAIDAINTLAAAKAAGQLKRDLRRYLRPRLLILDELGYLPIDKTGADLLFQIISQRYERGSIAITTNRVFKHWPEIFNHDATLTSAVLDRLLHHAETVTVEGNSFRMKDVIDN